MLYIIGTGLDIKDMSLKALEAIKKCKKVYMETYTNTLTYSVKALEKVIKKKIIIADRETVESRTTIITDAQKQNTALLVSGDPLSATTHFDLILRCKNQKIKFEIIHSVSVFNAVAETGLQLYKFGKTTSIPKWQKNFNPESFYEVIEQNLKINAHTLLLTDIGLPIAEALGYLRLISKKKSDDMLDRQIIVCERLGTDDTEISYGNLDVLMKKKFKLPACIVVPADLHFIEKEALKKL